MNLEQQLILKLLDAKQEKLKVMNPPGNGIQDLPDI